MQVKQLLNRLQKFKSFVYEHVRLIETSETLIIEAIIRPRAHSRPCCSQCTRPGPGYDTLAVRRFEFVPLWGLPVFFVYAPRRVECSRCGVRVERLPWATGTHHLTTPSAWFLARWAKRMSWQEVAEAFQTSWDHVFRSVEMAGTWGRAHMDLVVSANDAVSVGAHEERRSYAARASGAFVELVSRQREPVEWQRRGPEYQSQIDDQKRLWFSNISWDRNRLISYTWSFTRTRSHPQILLKSQNFLEGRKIISSPIDCPRQAPMPSRLRKMARNPRPAKTFGLTAAQFDLLEFFQVPLIPSPRTASRAVAGATY